jgi:hypothetical protein
MRYWTRSAPLRYNISDFFSSLLVFQSGRKPKTGVLKTLLGNASLKELTSGGTNSRKMVAGRIEFVRDHLS